MPRDEAKPAPPSAAAAAAADAAPRSTPAAPPLPVTLLSGFLGAGKTSLLRHILRERDPALRCAVIVNDMAELNIDAALVRGVGGVNAAANANANTSAAANAAAPLPPQRLVELQNGCICCTLRDDLLQEVASLAAAGRFDYLVIESTGVSEPMQVAEAFTMPIGVEGAEAAAEEEEDGATTTTAATTTTTATKSAESLIPKALRDVARLDTCVTVVDAAQLRDNLASLQTMRQRDGDAELGPARGDCANKEEEGEDPEGERQVSDLLLDQIEFADVLILNKTDLLPDTPAKPRSALVAELRATLRALNREAALVEATHGRVPLDQVMGTGRFSFERAAKAAGWLADLQPGAAPHTPETEEYGISSAVYRARRPFHPARLHAWLCSHFVLQQPDWSEAMFGAGEGEEGGPGGKEWRELRKAADALRAAADRAAAGGGGGGGKADADDALAAARAAARAAAAAAEAASSAARLASRHIEGGRTTTTSAAAAAASARAAAANALPADDEAAARLSRLRASYGNVMRSKGFAWIAGRDDHCAEWSQAGRVLRLGTGGPWFDVLPRSAWPTEPERVAAIEKDFLPGGIGDRRQELVFIGAQMDKEALVAALDGCLVTEEEKKALEAAVEAEAAAGGDAVSAEAAAAAAARVLGGADPFLPWPDIADIMDAGSDDEEDEEEEEEEEDHGEHEHDAEGRCVVGGAGGAEEDGDGTADEEEEEEEKDDDALALAGWTPGQVLEVTEGASEAQALLDAFDARHAAKAAKLAARNGSGASASSPPPVAVVEWLAPWAAASRAESPLFAREAASRPGALFLRVDVSAHGRPYPLNELLALEKVMARSVSRRGGGASSSSSSSSSSSLPPFPVPKVGGGGKWPVATVHVAPSLQPTEAFAGEGAAEKVAAALDGFGGGEGGGGGDDGAKLPLHPLRVAEVADVAQGAADLKRLLAACKEDGGKPLLVLWYNSAASNGNDASSTAAASLAAGAAAIARDASASAASVALADVSRAHANQVLASALGVKALPAAHVYVGMKAEAAIKPPADANGGSAAAEAVLALARAALAERVSDGAAAARLRALSPTAAEEAKQPNGSTNTTNTNPAGSSTGSVWDPPQGKLARPGARRTFPGKSLPAVFWPRMPCLRCGSPWWLGEDWDARCARCSWDCERDGYDDDSNPLPGFEAAFERFRALLNEGRTAEWPPAGAGAKGKAKGGNVVRAPKTPQK